MSEKATAFEAIAAHERLAEIVASARTWLERCSTDRKISWLVPATTADTIPFAVATFGNAMDVLERGPSSDAEVALLTAMLAHVAAESPREAGEDEEALARRLLFISAETAVTPLALVDRALGDDAIDFWEAVARVLRSGVLTQKESELACSALAATPRAEDTRRRLAGFVHDETLLALLGVTKTHSGKMPIHGLRSSERIPKGSPPSTPPRDSRKEAAAPLAEAEAPPSRSPSDAPKEPAPLRPSGRAPLGSEPLPVTGSASASEPPAAPGDVSAIRPSERAAAPPLPIIPARVSSGRFEAADPPAVAIESEVGDPAPRPSVKALGIDEAKAVSKGESESAPGTLELEGELAGAPRGALATIVLAFTGLLFVEVLVLGALRFALALKRPARVRVGTRGVELDARLEILGKTLTERHVVVPPGGLVRVTREVLYPRLSLYVGLIALALGSYLGVRIFVDGIRAASPSLLAVGAIVVLIGVVVDYAVTNLVPARAGRCRVLFEPIKGRRFMLVGVSREAADATFQRIKASGGT